MVKHLTVTEYDLQTLDDQLHADHLRDMLTMAFSHPQMTGFVIWGFWENRHWKPTAAMFRKDWSEPPPCRCGATSSRPSGGRCRARDRREGEAPLDAYYGWYDVTATKDGKTANFRRSTPPTGDGRP